MQFLQKGLEAHQRGNAAEAKNLYEKQLKLTPKDPNALQLYGMLLMALGKYSEALGYMRQSLQIEPEQVHVWNNLGSCFKKMNNLEEAKASYRRALGFEADFVQSVQNLLFIYLQEHNIRDAIDITAAAFEKSPEVPEIRRLYARACTAAGDYRPAITQYKYLLERYPEEIKLKNDLAITYRLNGQARESLLLLEDIAAGGTRSFALSHNIANALTDLGEITEACKHYQEAIRLNPGYIESHISLNLLLWESGQHDDFLASFEQALELEQSSPHFLFTYIDFLYRARRFESMNTLLHNEKIQLDKFSHYYYWFAKCLFEKKQFDEALNTLRSGLFCDDVNEDYKIEFAKQLLESHQVREAVKILTDILAIKPDSQAALAYLSLVKNVALDEQIASLNNYPELVREIDLSNRLLELGGSDFFSELAIYLRSLRSPSIPHLGQGFTKASQTQDNLFDKPNELLKAVMSVIKEAVVELQKNGIGSRNLEGKRTVEAFNICHSRVVQIVKSESQTPHISEGDCISAVFYVDIPDSASNESHEAGILEFGGSPLVRAELQTATYKVLPAIGKLVLFPSYMWHSIRPFQSDRSGLAIVFDVSTK